MTHTLCRWCKSWFGMCKAFPNRMQMQHNRFFFPVPLLLFFLVLVLPATAKTTINRGYKTHSFKQAIHLVVVKQSHSFSLPSFFLGAAAFFRPILSDTVMHFHLHSHIFVYCVPLMLPLLLSLLLQLYFSALWLMKQRRKKQRWRWWRRRRWHRDAFIHLSLWTLVFVRYT